MRIWDPQNESGFRKRGRRNGVASDFFRFFFRFLPFSSFFSVFSLFSFRFFRSLLFVPFSFCFFPFSSVCFRFIFEKKKKKGRHRSRDPFCETPIRMNFQEFPGSAFFVAFQNSPKGNPEFPGIFRHFPGDSFWGPQIAFSGEDEVDMLGSGHL